MKKIMYGFCSFLCVFLIILILMAVHGRNNRENENTQSLQAAVDETVKQMENEKRYTINNEEELADDFYIRLLDKIKVTGSAKVVDDKGNEISKEIESDKNFQLAVYKKYIKSDTLRGVNIIVKETFTHPNGKIGENLAKCTLLLDSNKTEEKHKISFVDPDGNVIKEYTLEDGATIKEPGVKTFDGKSIKEWRGFKKGMKAKEDKSFVAIWG